MTAIEFERIFQLVQTCAGIFIAAVRKPAVCLQKDGRPKVSVTIPPVAGATGGATSAENAVVQAVQLGAVGKLGLEEIAGVLEVARQFSEACGRPAAAFASRSTA